MGRLNLIQVTFVCLNEDKIAKSITKMQCFLAGFKGHKRSRKPENHVRMHDLFQSKDRLNVILGIGPSVVQCKNPMVEVKNQLRSTECKH